MRLCLLCCACNCNCAGWEEEILTIIRGAWCNVRDVTPPLVTEFGSIRYAPQTEQPVVQTTDQFDVKTGFCKLSAFAPIYRPPFVAL